jgi:glutathione S-transferase
MSLTFYFAPMSTASVTALVLEELEVPCERVKIDLRAGGTKTPEFLKINPNAKVPVIDHDGGVVWESTAITMYLGETFGVEKGLYPAPGPKRGEAMRWIAWGGVTLVDAIYQWSRNTSAWTPADHHNAKAGEVGRREIDNCLRILNDALDGRDYLLGTYTLADTHLLSLIDWLGHMQVDVAAFPHIVAWVARCKARPAYARSMASEG